MTSNGSDVLVSSADTLVEKILPHFWLFVYTSWEWLISGLKHLGYLFIVDVVEAHATTTDFLWGIWAIHVAKRKLIVGRFDCEGLHQLQNCLMFIVNSATVYFYSAILSIPHFHVHDITVISSVYKHCNIHIKICSRRVACIHAVWFSMIYQCARIVDMFICIHTGVKLWLATEV